MKVIVCPAAPKCVVWYVSSSFPAASDWVQLAGRKSFVLAGAVTSTLCQFGLVTASSFPLAAGVQVLAPILSPLQYCG